MEKYKKMEKEQEWWTLADAIERGEQVKKTLLEERYQQGLEKGVEQGIEKGIKEGIEKGIEKSRRDMLRILTETKFHLDANDWIDTLSYQELEQAVVLLLDCNSFEELQKQMKFLQP